MHEVKNEKQTKALMHPWWEYKVIQLIWNAIWQYLKVAYPYSLNSTFPFRMIVLCLFTLALVCNSESAKYLIIHQQDK